MAHKLLEGVDGGQPQRLQPRLLDTDQVSLDIIVDHLAMWSASSNWSMQLSDHCQINLISFLLFEVNDFGIDTSTDVEHS